MRARATCLLDLLEPRMTIEEDAGKKTESALVIDHVMMNPAELTTANGDNLEAEEEVVFGAAILGATVVEMEDDRVLTGIDRDLTGIDRDLTGIDQGSTAIDQGLTGIDQGLTATVVQALTVIAVQALAAEVALTEEIENRLPGVGTTKKAVLGRVSLGLEIAAKADLEIDAKAIDAVDLDHATQDLDPAIQEPGLLNIGRSN